MRRAAAALLALALAGPAGAQETDAFAGLPNVVVTTYPVTGTDAAAIRAAMNASRPTDPNDGGRVDALSRWSFRWRWRGDGHGRCDLATAAVSFSGTVTLPRLADPATLDPATLARWHDYMAALEAHEAGHLRYAWDHRGNVLAALRAATCGTAGAAGRAAIAAIGRHDVTYDAETHHGRLTGAIFP